MQTEKNKYRKFLLLLWFPIIAIFASLFNENNAIAGRIGNTIILRDTVTIVKTEVKDDLPEYCYVLRLLEADLNYKARRPKSQYIGGYQIGNSARTELGLTHLNNEGGYNIMLNDSTLQDLIFMRYLQDQVSKLQNTVVKTDTINYFTKYNNKKVGKWFVTNSGILAMSHLLGTENTKKFLDSNGKIITKDGNGRPITDYLQFNNFSIFVDSINNEEYLKRVFSKEKFSRPF